MSTPVAIEATPKILRASIDDAISKTSKVMERAKASSSLINFGISKFQWLASPVVTRAVAIGAPLVDRLDNNIEWIQTEVVAPARALAQTDAKESAAAIQNLVTNEWMGRVNEIFKSGTAHVKDLFDHFCATMADSLKNEEGVVDRDAFIKAIRTKMNAVWDDTLAGPVGSFYDTALEHLKDLQDKEHRDRILAAIPVKLGQVWREQVVATLQHKLDPALAVYRDAVALYMTFDTDGDSKVSSQEFIDGMRTRLGSQWTDKLEPALEEFLAEARQATTKDLARLHDALDYNHDGVITLGDFVGAGKSVANVVGVMAQGTWQGLLQYSATQLDRFLPEEKAAAAAEADAETAPLVVDEVEEKESKRPLVTLGQLRNSMSKRLRAKAESTFGEVRKFSARRLNDIIHIDLIDYAEKVIGNTVDRVKPHVKEVEAKLTQVQALLDQAVLRVQVAVEGARKVVDTNVQPVRAKLNPVMELLRQKLAVAIARARALSARGEHWVLNRQLTKLPSDAARFLVLLPSIVLGKSETDADFEETVALVQELMSAVKELFFWTSKSQQLEETAEAAEAADAAEAKEERKEPAPAVATPTEDEDEADAEAAPAAEVDETAE